MNRNVALFFILLAVSLFIYWPAHAQELGQPQPYSGKGQLTLGVGYYHYQAEWESDDPDMEPGKVKQNYVHLVATYGFVDNWEGYVMLGAADQVSEEGFPFDTPADFEDSFRPNAAVGVRGLLYQNGNFGFGPIVHAGIYSSYEDEKDGTITYPGYGSLPVTISQKTKDTWDLNIALGFQYRLEKVLFYGAPLYYMAKAKGEGTITTPAGVEEICAEGEEKNNFGGLAGVTFELTEGLNLNLEGQYKSDLSFGAFINKTFTLSK